MESPWPGSPITRRALIARMQAARASCIDNAPFLGLLGGLLLEDGDAEQALVWLERSLLLDPGSLGVQADHALALAALGQPEAVQEIARNWQGRSDLPPALRARLFPADGASRFALPTVKLGGQPERPKWGTAADISIIAGYESNLGRSPRLSQLTLTRTDGPEVLQVEGRPLAGAASVGSASFQAAYALSPATVVRSSVSLTARSSPSNHPTDWHQQQWGVNLSHAWNGIRGQVDAGSVWFGGDLGEAFRLQRLAVAADLSLGPCNLRLVSEHEKRSQAQTASLNASSRGIVSTLQCPVDSNKLWYWSIASRTGSDHPGSDTRPGGAQSLKSMGLSVTGALSWGTRLEASWRRSTVTDSTGYSVLLENNAVRRLGLNQFSLDLAHPLQSSGVPRVELLLQLQTAQQTSNLALFSYRAESLYGGVRWAW